MNNKTQQPPNFLLGLLIISVCLPVVLEWLLAGQLADASDKYALRIPAPFGTMGLLLVQSLATAALSLILAERIGELLGGLLSGSWLLMLAVIVSAGWLLVAPQLIAAVPISFSNYLLARLAIVVAIQTIWMLAISAHSTWRCFRGPVSSQTWAAALSLAVLLPTSYAQHKMATCSTSIEQYLDNNRLALARQEAAHLAMLGSSRPIRETSPAQLVDLLVRDVVVCQRRIAAGLPEVPTLDQVLQQARLHVAVATEPRQLNAAAELLRPHAQSRPGAALLLSAILESQSRPAEVAKLLAEFEPRLSELGEVESRRYRRLMASRRARSLHELGRNEQAKQLLLRSLEVAPEDAAFYLLKLGQHYHRTGSPLKARDYYVRAGAADERFEPRAKEAIAKLSHDMHICFLSE